MPEGRNSILLDTLGRGVVDTVGIDTVGDGVADTFYPAVAVDTDGDGKVDNVEVTTSLARKSSNIENGGASDRASTKDEFHRKQRELAALVAKVDAEAFTPRSDDADGGEDGGD